MHRARVWRSEMAARGILMMPVAFEVDVLGQSIPPRRWKLRGGRGLCRCKLDIFWQQVHHGGSYALLVRWLFVLPTFKLALTRCWRALAGPDGTTRCE